MRNIWPRSGCGRGGSALFFEAPDYQLIVLRSRLFQTSVPVRAAQHRAINMFAAFAMDAVAHAAGVGHRLNELLYLLAVLAHILRLERLA